MPKVKIKIDKFGNPTILDVCGAGKSCLEATKDFEKMLGRVAENSRQLTDEYFEEIDPQTLTHEGDA